MKFKLLLIFTALCYSLSYSQGDDCTDAINLCDYTDENGDGLYSGTTVGFNNDFTVDGGISSTDMLFYIDLPDGETITIGQTENNYDSEHELRYGGVNGLDCPGANFIVSDDDPDIQNHSWTNTTGSTQRVYWIQAGWSSNSGTFTLDWVVTGFPCGPPPTCPRPDSLFITSVTQNSATLNWNENGSATEWQIEYGLSPLTQGTGTLTSASLDSFVVAGLNPSSDYEFYVRAVCGVGDTSNWRKSNIFSTLCAPITAPYSQNFDANSAQNPFGGVNCWTVVGQGANDIATVTSTDDFVAIPSGPNCVEINDGVLSDGDSAILVSPEFSDLASGGNQIVFQAHQESGGLGTLYIGVMSNPNDASTFVMYDSITPTQLNSTNGFEEYTILMDNIGIIGANSFIAFMHGSDAYELYIDNFVYQPIPTCPKPQMLTVTNVTGNSALLGWTETGSATEWQIEYGTVPLTQGTGILISSSIDSIIISGLDPVTDYEFYVRAVCGAGDSSYWTGAQTFTTLCATYIPTYTQDFSSYLPDCWSDAGAGDLTTGPQGGFSGWSGSSTFDNEARVNIFSTGDDDWLLSPNFDLSGASYELALDVAIRAWSVGGPSGMGSDDYVALGYTEDGTNWVEIDRFTNTNGIGVDLTNYIFIIPSTGSNVQIGIYATNGNVDDDEDYYFYVDNFIIRPASTCPQPKQLQVSNLTGTTADLGWIEQGSATQWVVEYGTAPLNLGTGTITNTSSNPFSVTGLTPNTDYQFYVYSACGPGDSSYVVGPYSFSTPCATYTPEYLEEFNSYLPTCWKEAGDGDLVSGPSNYGTSSWGQDNEFGSEASINLYQSDNNNWLISPNFDLSGGDYELSVDVAVTDFGGGAPSNMGADDVVRFMYSEDGLVWNNIKKFTAADNIQDSLTNYVFPINSNGSNVVFAIYATDGAIDNAEDYEFYVDNFEIRDLTPSCDSPDSLMLVSNDGTSATLSWNDNSGATQWDIQYGETGFTLGSGTIINVNTNPYTLTGLTENTNYDFYVKSYCPTGGGTSVYSNGKMFNSTSLSINENLNSLISVYPNPTKDVVNIEMSEIDNNSTIQIISLTGETLKNVRVNSNITVINVEELASGIYTVKVQNDNGTGFQKLIIE